MPTDLRRRGRAALRVALISLMAEDDAEWYERTTQLEQSELRARERRVRALREATVEELIASGVEWAVKLRAEVPRNLQDVPRADALYSPALIERLCYALQVEKDRYGETAAECRALREALARKE